MTVQWVELEEKITSVGERKRAGGSKCTLCKKRGRRKVQKGEDRKDEKEGPFMCFTFSSYDWNQSGQLGNCLVQEMITSIQGNYAHVWLPTGSVSGVQSSHQPSSTGALYQSPEPELPLLVGLNSAAICDCRREWNLMSSKAPVGAQSWLLDLLKPQLRLFTIYIRPLSYMSLSAHSMQLFCTCFHLIYRRVKSL